MKRKILGFLMCGVALSALLSSCVKNDINELTNQGATQVKILEAPENKFYFSPFTDTKKLDLFSLRRDANSEAALKTAQTLKLSLAPAIIDNYNAENGDNFEVLPDAMYTLVGDAFKKVGGGYDVPFNSGDFAKDFTINLDGSKWTDLGKKYALAFRVTDAQGNKLADGKDSIMVIFAIKNKWDGVYTRTGTMVDVTNATLTHINNFLSASGPSVGLPTDPIQIELRTISPTQCVVYDNYFFGGYYLPIASGATYSQYGSFCPIVEFDPATNKVVSVTNYYGQPASNGRSGRLDPDGVNTYDPESKTVTIKYNMTQPASVPAAPHVRTTWDEEWKFIGARQ